MDVLFSTDESDTNDDMNDKSGKLQGGKMQFNNIKPYFAAPQYTSIGN